MTDAPDPTRPLIERTPDELVAFVDDHLLLALEGASNLAYDRQLAEDAVRDRLVALSDTYPTLAAVRRENTTRKHNRLRTMLATEGAKA